MSGFAVNYRDFCVQICPKYQVEEDPSPFEA
jgi:hypothetical protein